MVKRVCNAVDIRIVLEEEIDMLERKPTYSFRSLF
jgi:hypothetical protein